MTFQIPFSAQLLYASAGKQHSNQYPKPNIIPDELSDSYSFHFDFKHRSNPRPNPNSIPDPKANPKENIDFEGGSKTYQISFIHYSKIIMSCPGWIMLHVCEIFPEAPRGPQKHREAPRSLQTLSEAPRARSPQKPPVAPEIPKSLQKHPSIPDAPRSPHTPKLRRTQKLSMHFRILPEGIPEATGGHQKPPDASRTKLTKRQRLCSAQLMLRDSRVGGIYTPTG